MSSKYQMWMTFNGGTEKLQFPVLPEQIDIRKGLITRSVNIQDLGETIVSLGKSAIIISFSSFFPAAMFPGVQISADEMVPPNDLKDKITVWQKSDKPVRFFVTGPATSGIGIGLYYKILNFPYFERGGDVGTLQYSLVLKEYTEVRARKVQVRDDVAIIPEPAPVRVDNRITPYTHTVVSGDNLTFIARRYLGDGNRWREIFDLNRDIISNPCLIFPGWVLRLPAA